MARLKESRIIRPVTTKLIPPPKEKSISTPKKKAISPPKEKPTPPKNDKERSKKRYRPGSKALNEIRRYQRGTSFLIPTASFQRLVRQMMASLSAKVTRYFIYIEIS